MSDTPASHVQLLQHGRTATITIDRQHARNAIARSTIAELESALDKVADADTGVLVLRGGGERAFISGGDLKDLASLRTEDQAVGMAMRMRRLLDRVAALPIPTVAALSGNTLGGGAEVAVACDFRVAVDDVAIAFNQSRLAIMPAWGGAERLTHLVGRSSALRLLLTGERIGAADALRLGLFDLLAPRSEFDATLHRFAHGLASLPTSVSTSIKATVDAAAPNRHPDLEHEAVRCFARLWAA